MKYLVDYDGNVRAFPPSTIPAQDGYYRHSSTQIITPVRSLLLIDGLHPHSFNNFSWNVWDAANSKIIAKDLKNKLGVRLTFKSQMEADNSINFEFDIGSDRGVIYPMNFQPSYLENAPNGDSADFYVSPVFLANGCSIYVKCANPTSVVINSAALYITCLAQ